ncbi:AMMECR1 domain-containing protein [Calycina marina]|uniref:AMMECR1 domain-containing protein n=1 Tax=Calycina marina TaxID=1763456 RepID=A0A9P8CBN4_9HELO|nr:AMMECR1 domain-containing protein [Calycina marina]
MATPEHCLYCFETLAAKLEDRRSLTLPEIKSSYASYQVSTASSKNVPIAQQPLEIPRLAQLPDSSASTPSSSSSSSLAPSSETANSSSTSLEIDESPLFVTWNTIERYGLSLRGCIGTFEAQPLDEGISSYALISALHDTRFSPISSRELSSLSVSVTLLTNFEPAEDPMDWELGTHGIRISFVNKGRRFESCYLPDVATEQGWTKEETIISLMRKAGWGGKKDKWREVGDIKVVRYRGDALRLDYPAFKEWREWVAKK